MAICCVQNFMSKHAQTLEGCLEIRIWALVSWPIILPADINELYYGIRKALCKVTACDILLKTNN